ncbi:MAG: class I SAM-dependent methyltransferase [Pseudomonadota bacterium]
MAPKVSIDLTGVPETMLWPLWNRAAEQEHPDRILDDPLAADLVKRIDVDFYSLFGKPTPFHAIRARYCDDLIRAFTHNTTGNAIVVALGNGLETQNFRLGELQLDWVMVDLPEAIEVRRRLLPDDARARHLALSALDLRWTDDLPRERPIFISAAGLLMYFREDEVRALLSEIAAKLPGAELFFDTIPKFFSQRTMRGMKITDTYTAPQMPWGISVTDIEAWMTSIQGWSTLAVGTYADPFPHRLRVYKLLSFIPGVQRLLAPGLVHAVARSP